MRYCFWTPVFSSPVQPTAVPFRTSPASPQPIASYSSNSSLPTSSPPPNFSNGLMHQTEELAFAPHADSPDLLFSAYKAWNLQTGTECCLNGAVGSVSSIVVDEDLVFAGMEDGNIMAWKWNSESNIHEPANVLKGHNGAVCSLVIGAGKLYSGSTNCTIKEVMIYTCTTLSCNYSMAGLVAPSTSEILMSRHLVAQRWRTAQ